MPSTTDRECPIVLVSESVLLLDERGVSTMATGLKEAINTELDNRASSAAAGNGTLGKRSAPPPELPTYADGPNTGTLSGRKKLSITHSDYEEGESIYHNRRGFYGDEPAGQGPPPPPASWNRKYDAREALDEYVGFRDVCGNKRLWKMLLAEFVGTLFLVLVGCGSCIGGWKPGYEPSMVQIALAFGIAVATMAQAIGHVSGCHINPAVTLGLLAAGKCSLLKSIVFIIAQCIGAICGSAILETITPESIKGNLGLTTLSPKLDALQGMFVEALITFVLVLTVCGVCDNLRKDIKGSAPLAIGLSITVCHLMAIQYTGSSMNPARSLGPAVISRTWDHHWIYWAGPILGGVVAGFLYQVSFRESLQRDT